MQQAQRLRPEHTRSRLKAAFWSRDSITTACVVYLIGAFTGYAMFVSPVIAWLGERLGTSHLGIILLFCYIFSVPAIVSGWLSARLVPRWCLVPWAVLNTAFFLLRILPELRVTRLRGEWWQFCELLISCLIAFVLQTGVLFATRRRAGKSLIKP